MSESTRSANPPPITDLASFRAWVRSSDFPATGRIDWVRGHLAAELSPEDLNTHGSPKSAVAVALGMQIQETERGIVFIDRARISNPAANLSAEPDVLVLLFESLEAGRARLVPRKSGADRYLEIEGAADLVFECVSDSSVVKDNDQLPECYHRAGVSEYWLADVRGEDVRFDVFLHS